ETRAYDYIVRPDDTLSEITLMFTGTHDYDKIARQNRISNPDLIYPGDVIRLLPTRPLETLRDYLDAIYRSKEMKAYKLLSTHTRSNISYDEFKNALDKITFYNLNSMYICSDFIENENHILQLKILLAEDPASWGFSLIREKYKWHILLFDLNPTNPQDDGFIEWKCNGSYNKTNTNMTVTNITPHRYLR
ncbi:MAG: LysM peptidoglycan-binding domain-containing protein, partial [Deltaproteobacteria bacterium]|nr:LysM peptidoglycan-binding domain-containing protein [Deltaproteobacteria bacterium]